MRNRQLTGDRNTLTYATETGCETSKTRLQIETSEVKELIKVTRKTTRDEEKKR